MSLEVLENLEKLEKDLKIYKECDKNLKEIVNIVNKDNSVIPFSYLSEIADILIEITEEDLWTRAYKAIIKTSIMVVVKENAKDKITDEKIRILYRDEFKKNNITIPNKITLEDIKDGLVTKELADKIIDYTVKYTKEYENLTQKEKDKLREKFFEELIEDIYSCMNEEYFQQYLINYFNGKYNCHLRYVFYKKKESADKLIGLLKDELYYNLDEFLKEFNNSTLYKEREKLGQKLTDWKVLNELRPHPEFQNLYNVYDFINKSWKTFPSSIMDSYISTFQEEDEIYRMYAPCLMGGTRTRFGYFNSTLINLIPISDVYVYKPYKAPSNYDYFFVDKNIKK